MHCTSPPRLQLARFGLGVTCGARCRARMHCRSAAAASTCVDLQPTQSCDRCRGHRLLGRVLRPPRGEKVPSLASLNHTTESSSRWRARQSALHIIIQLTSLHHSSCLLPSTCLLPRETLAGQLRAVGRARCSRGVSLETPRRRRDRLAHERAPQHPFPSTGYFLHIKVQLLLHLDAESGAGESMPAAPRVGRPYVKHGLFHPRCRRASSRTSGGSIIVR